LASDEQLARAKTTFIQACRFVFAHERLKLSTPDTALTAVMLPAMVMEAFAIELLLKTLLLMEGKEPSKVHELEKLYRRLHVETQRALAVEWDRGPRVQLGKFADQQNLPTELPLALEKCSSAYAILRYAHEDPNKCVFYLGALPRMLQDFIEVRQPDWVRWVLID
jgi:hypothetical protein